MEVLSMPAAGPAPCGALELLPSPRYRSAAAEASEGSCDDGSLASSSTDLHQLQQQAEQQQQQQQQACGSSGEAAASGRCQQDAAEPKTHHLLKHCLSASQRGAALAHFNTGDAREAAKEIARMGQRELQAKFKEVYGSATKSNNNSWLRRKLYEAVGVAPLKASTKGKARKAAPSHGSHARKPAQPKDAQPKAHRAPKVAPVRTKRPGGSADLLGVASPLYYSAGMSVLDQQQSSDATASDSDDGGHGTPRSAGALAYAGTVFSGQPLGGAPLSPPPAGFVPCEPQSPSASGAHWADQGAGWAAGAPRASTPFLTAASGTLPRGACAGLADFAAPPACAWEPAPAEPPCPASDLAAGHWYFGSLDLACLPMDCSGGGACDCTGPSCCRDDEDEVPLLTLDLGAIDMSV